MSARCRCARAGPVRRPRRPDARQHLQHARRDTHRDLVQPPVNLALPRARTGSDLEARRDLGVLHHRLRLAARAPQHRADVL